MEDDWQVDYDIIGYTEPLKHYCGFKTKSLGEWRRHVVNCPIDKKPWQLAIFGYSGELHP